ncbi:hypothetical protein P3L10_006454 [Capsicum annuum]
MDEVSGIVVDLKQFQRWFKDCTCSIDCQCNSCVYKCVHSLECQCCFCLYVCSREMNVEEIQTKVVSDDYAIAELLKIENSILVELHFIQNKNTTKIEILNPHLDSRFHVLAIEDTIPKLMDLNDLSGYYNVIKHLDSAPSLVSIKVHLDKEIGSTLFDIKTKGDILVAFWVPHATIGSLSHVLVLFIYNWVDAGQVFWALYDRGKLGVYSFSRVLFFSFVDGFLFLNVVNAEAKLPTLVVVKSEDWDECASTLIKIAGAEISKPTDKSSECVCLTERCNEWTDTH